MASINKYLIVLEGQGDTDIILANPAAEAWISKPAKFGKSCWKETIPAAVLAGHELDDADDDYDPRKPEITIGSYDNDRALSCPGEHFGSMKELMSYCSKHNITITGEYHGYIY